MTIDEAIKHAREVAEENRKQEALEKQCELYWNVQKCRRCAEEHEQLAEWLEELKCYQEQHIRMCEYHEVATVEHIYNKAIDDFENKILSNCASMLKDGDRVIVIRMDIFKFILGQLKAGREK